MDAKLCPLLPAEPTACKCGSIEAERTASTSSYQAGEFRGVPFDRIDRHWMKCAACGQVRVDVVRSNMHGRDPDVEQVDADTRETSPAATLLQDAAAALVEADSPLEAAKLAAANAMPDGSPATVVHVSSFLPLTQPPRKTVAGLNNEPVDVSTPDDVDQANGGSATEPDAAAFAAKKPSPPPGTMRRRK